LVELDLKSGSVMGYLSEPLPNKVMVQSKITEPDWTKVQGPKTSLNRTQGPVQGSKNLIKFNQLSNLGLDFGQVRKSSGSNFGSELNCSITNADTVVLHVPQ
jgi:hypothetical protein